MANVTTITICEYVPYSSSVRKRDSNIADIIEISNVIILAVVNFTASLPIEFFK